MQQPQLQKQQQKTKQLEPTDQGSEFEPSARKGKKHRFAPALTGTATLPAKEIGAYDSELALFFEYQQTKKYDDEGKLVASDLKLRNKLAEQNIKLVTFAVNKFYSKKQKHKELRADLLQEGHLGLIKAIDGFKPELGFRFSTYALWWITQCINEFLQDKEVLIKVPGHIKTLKNKLSRAAKESGVELEDLSTEALTDMNVTTNMFEACVAASKVKNWTNASLEAPLSTSVDRTMYEVLPNESSEDDLSDSYNRIDRKKLVEACSRAFDKLTLRERHVMLERFGVDSSYLVELAASTTSKQK